MNDPRKNANCRARAWLTAGLFAMIILGAWWPRVLAVACTAIVGGILLAFLHVAICAAQEGEDEK